MFQIKKATTVLQLAPAFTIGSGAMIDASTAKYSGPGRFLLGAELSCGFRQQNAALLDIGGSNSVRYCIIPQGGTGTKEPGITCDFAYREQR